MIRPTALALIAGLAGLAVLALYGGSARAADGPAAMQAADLRISQVYGGGGNTGAPLMCDFIEIFNAGATTLSVNGFSVQYASSAGTTWQVTPLTGSIPAGRYFLVQEACGANGVALPTPDVTGAIAMSGTTGKVALVNSITALAGQGLGDPTVIDFVGYGTPSSCEGSPAGACTTAAPTLSNTLAALRGNDGCTDTDNNMADFTALAPSPRNSASPPKSCGIVIPTATTMATPVPTPEFLEANTSFTLADPFDCTAAGDVLNAELVFVNSGQATAFGVVLDLPLPARVVGRAGSCTASGGQNGTCTIDEDGLTWTGNVPALPPANVVAINFDVRVAGGTTLGTEMCLGAVLNYPRVGTGPNDSTLPIGTCATVDCLPTVDPNRQLGGQVHLPILDFQGQDDVCESWIEVQLLGCDPAKAVLVTWGAPGFCPPQAAGPLKVECTGLLVPGAGWMFHGAQVPTGSKSGIFFKFTARQLSEVGIDFGFDDVVADLMCEELFFGIVGDADDYRRFKKAYNEGLEFRGIPLRLAIGDGYLAVEVLRRCPGDLTPGSIVASKYNGIAGTHLGTYDPIYGGFAYYAPLVYADKGGFNTILYVQNGGLECSSVEIWFKAQDDCLRARICDIATLAPGETYQYDATSCVGPDWQGSAWIRASEPMGVAVDIVGRDVLMTYIAEPSELNFSFNPDHPYASEGNRVAFGPLIFSEYQGWDSGIQVQNQSPVFAAKVKVYFLDRSGDVITTLVDWICPRGSQTYFLPVVHDLPGNWVGSVRAESQDWWTPGTSEVHGPNIVGVAQLMRYDDAARTQTTEAIAYNLLPEHKVFDWQVGANAGGTESGVGLIAIPSLIKDLDKAGITSEVAIQNAVAKPGFTDFAIYIFDQNGLLDFVCQKLHDQQVEYIDLQTWGYVSPGFKGSAIISATYWSHEVFDGGGFFLRNLLGLAAVSVERIGTRLGEDVPGDEAAGERGIPFSQQGIDEPFVYCFAGPAVAFCPGQPGQRPVCPDKLTLAGQGGDIPDDRAGGEVFTGNIAVNFPSLPGQCVVEDVNLFLNIEHDETRDLDVALSHIDLRNDMFADICFDDEGVLVTLDDDDPDGNGPIGNTASCAGTGPVGAGDTYTTQSGTGLEDFAGKDPRGQWSLIVDDDFQTTFGFGRVVEWRLILDIGVAP